MSAPLKILFVMDAFCGGSATGGTEAQLLQLVRRLDRRRFEPRLALFRATAFSQRADAFPCPVEVLDITRLRTPSAVRRLMQLAARVRASGIRLVHTFLNDASIAAPPFCRMAGARVLGSRRDMGFWHTAGQLATLRASNRFVHGIVANSEAVRAAVTRTEGFPDARVHVIYNGHDPERFDVSADDWLRPLRGIGPTDPVIGMVANLNTWKRHADLIDAFAMIHPRYPRAHVVLVGSGLQEHALKEQVRALGLARRVHFLGGISDVVPVIKQFTIGVLCSESEGLSNAVIEYMSCGKPVVSTNVGGNAEIVDEGKTGFLVQPGDVAQLAARIELLLQQPALANEMGQRARDASRRFTADRMADAHMSLYQQLAASA